MEPNLDANPFWEKQENVTCVVCPDCGFTFDAFHTEQDGVTYVCPCCQLPPISPDEKGQEKDHE